MDPSPAVTQSRNPVSFLLVLAGLAAVGWWGHVTHWKFVPGQNSHSAPASSNGAAISRGNAERLELRTTGALQKSGIEFATVIERPMDAEIVANGVITYDQTRIAQLSSRVVGTVWRVEKQVGQPIQKGDVLAIIDAAEVGRIKADFLQAVVAERLKKVNMERLREARSAVPDRTIREAEAAHQEALIRLFNAQQTLVNLGLPIRLEEIAGLQDAALAQRIHFLGLPASITAQLDPETTTANLVPLIAPFHGVVIGQVVALGERVDADDAHHFEIADVSQMWINLDVRAEDAARVRLGQEIVFTVDGTSQELRSTISWISTQVDEKNRMLEVRATVANPIVHSSTGDQDVQRLLLANSFGTGKIVLERKESALVVPAQAIQRDGVQPVVFVQVDDRVFEQRSVTLGIQNGPFAEIVNGVELGNTVATAGSHVLKSEVVRLRMTAGGSH
jgi:membrane fusion protein, heavy metal efflux system